MAAHSRDDLNPSLIEPSVAILDLVDALDGVLVDGYDHVSIDSQLDL